MTHVEEANERAMARYRAGVIIELTADNDLLVTLNGHTTVNSVAAFESALCAIVGRNAMALEALGEARWQSKS